MPASLNSNSTVVLVFLALIGAWILIAIFQYLWNITMPDVFKLPEISFWQAFRLILIASFLFGGSFLLFRSGG